MMRKIVYFLIFSSILLNAPVYSQDCGDGEFDPNPCGDNPDAIPLDGGVSLLIGAGALYGISKLKKQKDSSNEQHPLS